MSINNKTLAAIIVDALADKDLLGGMVYSQINSEKWEEAADVVWRRIDRYHPSSIQQGSGTSCDGNLDIPYPHQYVQNESSNISSDKKRVIVYHPFAHGPILPGTVVGIVNVGNMSKSDQDDSKYIVQTFVVDEEGNFTFTKVGTPEAFVEKGEIDHKTGVMTLYWNKPAPRNKIVYSYEYDMACSK